VTVSRRAPIHLLPGSRDGTSQRSRHLAALDPAHALIDERTNADILRFVQRYVEQLRFFESDGETGEVRTAGTWADFARRADISIADMVAYLEEPARFAGERARWLGRPHFALLLAFVELLARAREQLNGFTRRHLDYYYRDLLQMKPEAPVPDHATVAFGLRPGATEVRISAGTELKAWRDASGVPRVYRTEREIVVNRATVAQTRSVFVDRRITGISDVRADRSLTAPEALERTLAIALGSPKPGDPVPRWENRPIDFAFLVGLRGLLDFAQSALYLEHHELRALMRLVRRRSDADAEWNEINRLMGGTNPSASRDFQTNLIARVGVLDFAADGLPQVGSIDDLYTYRTEPDVRAYINTRLAAIPPDPPRHPTSFDSFVALMQIKLRIDAEWAEINRLLERAGRLQRNLLEWSLPLGDPTDFARNLALALQGRWPPPWPEGTRDIDEYEALLRRLEVHLSMPIERVEILVSFAELMTKGNPPKTQSDAYNWSEVDRILADAHTEKVRAARRAKLVEARRGLQGQAAFDAVARFVLGEKDPIYWTEASKRLAEHLDPSKLDLLARFRDELGTSHLLFGFDWTDADRLFEQAWRHIEGLPAPVAQKIEVHNIYAYEDATQVKDNAASPGWKPFGRLPLDPDDKHPHGAQLGWALRSPLLSLSEGQRTLTLTLGLRGEGFDQAEFLAALGLGAGDRSGDQFARALEAVMAIEVSTAKGWIELSLATAQLASGTVGDDYWSLLGVPRTRDEDRPALQLRTVVDVSRDPIAPLRGESQTWPALRLSLRPRWNNEAKEWRMLIEPFTPIVLSAVHLKVEVEGLTALRLQHDDRQLDPGKPFEPFGSRPAVGARLYLEHPELVRARLDRLRFNVEWMGLPALALKDHYFNYPGLTASSSVFKTRVVLVDRNNELKLGELSLFEDLDNKTQPTRSLAIDDVPAAIRSSKPDFTYVSRSDLAPANDIRLASRYLRWELAPVDFGHGIYASLAATKARELAVGITNGTVKTEADAAKYRVDPPYTPTIKRLTIAYSSAIEIDLAAPAAEHQILHVHPFGVCSIDDELPSLLPRYDIAGELYIGVRDLRPPQHLTLLLQLVEGTSDPDVERDTITWSYLKGDRFADLFDTGIVQDSTEGLINSGIVELDLPSATSSGRLPPNLYWLRIAISRNPESVCDIVAIRSQAVSVRFDDRGNAASHYEQPLPVGSIARLLEPNAAIAKIEQPYSSFGGKPAEDPALFDTRVSERLRHKDRALAPWDYERLVLHYFRQIYKAKCLSSTDGVEVVVIPDIRELHPSDTFAPKAPASLLAAIQGYLTDRAPAAARVRVRNAQYVSVQVRLGIRFREGVDEGFAQRRLNEDLIRFLSPWAFEEGAEVTFGGRIYANSIVDFADRLDYVDYVTEIRLFRSMDGKVFNLILPVAEEHVESGQPDEVYYVETDQPSQVLVSAQQHYFDVIPDTGVQQVSFTGINYTRIELDFIVK
jgi:hypothetical protein